MIRLLLQTGNTGAELILWYKTGAYAPKLLSGGYMAATRLIALHINKGRTLARCLSDRTDYSKNGDKTDYGRLVSSYACDPETCDEEFLLSKRQYHHITGREQKNEVIAYQIRQSFKPGEVSPEDANRIGYELCMRFTKGKHAFIVATHTDKAHIHNHIIFNSTTIDGTGKFRNFRRSGLALQRVSDIVCLENGLSVIEPKPKKEREQRSDYPKRDSFRNTICDDIRSCLRKRPKDFDEFLRLMEQFGYEVKRGKNIAFKGKGQQRFIRMRSLGDAYSEQNIRAVLAGDGILGAEQGQVHRNSQFNLLVDIQDRLKDTRSPAYRQWATVYNLKQMSATFLFLRENHIESFEDLERKSEEAVRKFNELNESVKTAENRLAEILAIKKHILNYRKTRDAYITYRQSGYSKEFFENHREEITLHKAAKTAFDQLGVQKLPTIRKLNEEYDTVLKGKKKDFAAYREAKRDMQEYLKAKRNVEMFYQEQAKRVTKNRKSERI